MMPFSNRDFALLSQGTHLEQRQPRANVTKTDPTNGEQSSRQHSHESPAVAAKPAKAQTRIHRVRHGPRYCTTPGCYRTVKSQGVCQRHGAVAKKCKILGCGKQAQGNFSKMCSKSNSPRQAIVVKLETDLQINSHHRSTVQELHFKECQSSTDQTPVNLNTTDQTIPMASRPAAPTIVNQVPLLPIQGVEIVSVYDSILPCSVGFVKKSESDTMPLARHLKNGYLTGKAEAWHRSEERMARRLPPFTDPQVPLEEWERELAWTEILLLSGSTGECFHHWARAWGCEDGSDAILTQLLKRNNVTSAGHVPGEEQSLSTSSTTSSSSSLEWSHRQW